MKFPDKYRVTLHPMFRSSPGDTFGTFVIPDGCDRLCCIVSDGRDPLEGLAPWEHVSISVRNKRGLPLRRCPTWEQMCLVKEMFWDEEDAVMQLHPPKSDWVNNHPFCLHLWRPVGVAIPLPPSIYVGVKGVTLPV